MLRKHVVKLSIDTTLHRDLTIGEWTAVVVRGVLADHRLWGTVFQSRFNFCEYVAHWGKCMKAAALSKFVNRWVWQKLPKPSVRKHLCQRHVQGCAQWRPYIWNPVNLSWQCKQTEYFFSAEKHRPSVAHLPLAFSWRDRIPHNCKVATPDEMWVELIDGEVLPFSHLYRQRMPQNMQEEGLDRAASGFSHSTVEFAWICLMHHDASWFLMHSACILLGVFGLFRLGTNARYCKVCWDSSDSSARSWQFLEAVCDVLQFPAMSETRPRPITQRISTPRRDSYTAPEATVLATAPTAAGRYREMPGDAGRCGRFKLDQLGDVENFTTTRLKPSRNLDWLHTQLRHHGWNRIRSFVLGKSR